MIASLRETKAHLSEYLQLADKGEDIVITVRGKPKARLTAIHEPQRLDRMAWGRRLHGMHQEQPTKVNSSAAIVSELREERL